MLLTLHPHLHCIVPAGGITKAKYWKTTRSNGKFLFPVKALSKVFRARYVAALRKAFPAEPKMFFEKLFQTPWVVYAKRPFGGPLQVIEYLGRYTHKIAISNHRISEISNETVTFTYKDYRHADAKKQMTLKATEFVRRFALHILPKGFVRIRHYGILSSRLKITALTVIREQLQHKHQPIEDNCIIATRQNPDEQKCPCCKNGVMKHLMDFDFRGPPSLQFLREMINIKENSCVTEKAV